jgi:ATP/maltotriose-dependent transcriptional regulator MalT
MASITPWVQAAEDALAQHSLDDEQAALVYCYSLAVRAFMAVVVEEYSAAIHLSTRALEAMPPGMDAWRGTTLSILGQSYLALGDGSAAIATLSEAKRLALAGGATRRALTIVSLLSSALSRRASWSRPRSCARTRSTSW